MNTTHLILLAISLSLPLWTLWSASRTRVADDEAQLYIQIGQFIRDQIK